MTRRIALAAVITVFSVMTALPTHLHGQQTTEPVDHSAHQPAAAATQTTPPATGAMGPMASSAKLNELVKTMNSAKGDAKIAAMAELLTTLANDRQSCEPMMASMMKMNSMGGANGMPMPTPAK